MTAICCVSGWVKKSRQMNGRQRIVEISNLHSLRAFSSSSSSSMESVSLIAQMSLSVQLARVNVESETMWKVEKLINIANDPHFKESDSLTNRAPFACGVLVEIRENRKLRNLGINHCSWRLTIWGNPGSFQLISTLTRCAWFFFFFFHWKLSATSSDRRRDLSDAISVDSTIPNRLQRYFETMERKNICTFPLWMALRFSRAVRWTQHESTFPVAYTILNILSN